MSADSDGLDQPELVSALRNYLPSSLQRECLSGQEIRAPQACVGHLDALLHTVSTYLPHQVVTPLTADPERSKVEGGFTYGTVMFSDISGFTAMSEKLSRLGKEGAEEITTIVNRFFAALLRVTDRYDGDLLKFGGDALLVYFGGPDHAHRACLAAQQMQATMSRFSETTTSQGVFRLLMTIGLGTGPLFMARLGTEDRALGSMEFAVMGQTMSQMAQAEDQASAGEIFIDDTTYHAVAHYAIIGRTVGSFCQFVGFDETAPIVDLSPEPDAISPPTQQESTPSQIVETLRCIQALELFLPPGLMDKIKLEPERIAIGGEYRSVTVLFANFYGIDEIIQHLGQARSAEITAILNAHFQTMRQIISKYGGVVNKVDSYAVGHRIMALFGAPRAHIDDPERAVRAALEMQEAMAGFAELHTSCGAFCLKQRIGVNTGLVFAGNVGSLSRQEYSVMGDEVNLTARLMAVAAEGQVIISQSTARQTGDCFLLREQDPVHVKGKSLPVHNYEVLGLQDAHARAVRERRPLVGRDREWQAVHALTDASLAGTPQILTIVGSVGLGKSRLLEEISAHWTEAHGARCISATCPSFGRHTPYLPWLDLLREVLAIGPADDDQTKIARIDDRLCALDPTWHDWTNLVGLLLGLNIQESDVVRALDAQTRQRTIFRVVTGLLDHVASEQPLLLVIDDLQWADDTSIELVNHAARQVTDRPFLLVLAHRPEESLALDVSDLPGCTTLRLQELSDEDSLRLLDVLLPTTPQMPGHLKQLILDKARGNPLFLDAMAHALIENYLALDPETGTYQARTDLEQIEVPDSVNRVIMSRIDRLEESDRNVLRVASVIGQEFQHWLLSAIYPYRQAEGELSERLDQLSQREILAGPYPDLMYLFRHILTREVAYESLLYADRRQLHQRIGESIEKQRAGRLAEYWEVLAYHFGLAEKWDKALHYHLEAGQKAQAIYANDDAIHHFRRAVEVAAHVPDSQDRLLDAHDGLSQVLDTLGEYDRALAHNRQAQDLVPEIEATPESRARRLADLCRKAASIHEKQSDYDAAFSWLQGGLDALEGIETIEKAQIYRLGAGIYFRQGNHGEAIAWCEESLAVAEKTDEGREKQAATAHAYLLLGLIYSRLGDMARTIEFCRQSIEINEQIGDIREAGRARTNMAIGYYNQGDWASASEHYLAALETMRRIGDPYNQAVIALNLGGVYLNLGDLDQATHYNQESLDMWRQLGSTYAIALLHNNMSMVALRRGDSGQAQALLRESLELFQQINSTDFMPEVYRHMAEASLQQGELDRALDQARHSLALAQEHDMRLEESATRRVLGQVHLALGELPTAERELTASLETLRELDSRYEVGQTLLQLATLYRRQERHAEADAALTESIDIFEALGARLDLQDARAVTNP